MCATICAKVCATLQCYKVKDQLTEVDDAQLLFEVTFKEGADCSDDQSFPFQGINIFHVHLRLFYFVVLCIFQMYLDKICNNLQKQLLVVFDIECH